MMADIRKRCCPVIQVYKNQVFINYIYSTVDNYGLKEILIYNVIHIFIVKLRTNLAD